MCFKSSKQESQAASEADTGLTLPEREAAEAAKQVSQQRAWELERQGLTPIDKVPSGAPFRESDVPGWVKQLGGDSAPGGRVPRRP